MIVICGRTNMSRADLIYRKILLTKFFTHGWGKPENLKKIFNLRRQLSNRITAASLTSHQTHTTRVEVTKEDVKSDHVILKGHFVTPLVKYLPGLLPKETEKAHFQFYHYHFVMDRAMVDSRLSCSMLGRE